LATKSFLRRIVVRDWRADDMSGRLLRSALPDGCALARRDLSGNFHDFVGGLRHVLITIV